jgi:hypothetical protein
MQNIAGNAPTLSEWSSFLTVLNGSRGSDRPLLSRDESSTRMIVHLEKRFPAMRKYCVGKQLKLFAS